MGDAILIGVCLLLIVLPAKYDPAIWLKERNERRRITKDHPHD